MNKLDIFSLPLQNQILIEASAGTGKTYTLAFLFLRLLLEKKISVEQILVVTYTRAATAELRGRIRLRISEALAVLGGQNSGDKNLDDFILSLPDKKEAEILLKTAFARMDEAAIYTIHSFCQRVLQEFAFETSQPMQTEFLETEDELQKDIIHDFWRREFSSLNVNEAKWIQGLWANPDDLLKLLSPDIGREDLQILPVVTTWQRYYSCLESMLPLLQKEWLAEKDNIREILADGNMFLKSKGYSSEKLEEALTAMDNLCRQDDFPWYMDKILELLTASKIKGSLKKRYQNEPPQHPFFKLFDRFFRMHQVTSKRRKIAILKQAREYLQSELQKRKEKNGQLYFDDLVVRLDKTLASDKTDLAAKLHKKYPYILVDEFQDTDSYQYSIFSRIHSSSSAGALFLIGDPKQAIYSFRGADIYTYLQAKEDTATENRYTMKTNYRSSPQMVEQMNKLYGYASVPPFKMEGIDYERVNSGADTKLLLLDSKPLSPFSWFILPENENKKKPSLSKDAGNKRVAKDCAHKIKELLQQAARGKAVIGDRALNGGDIAVLVPTNRQAEMVRKELARHGISSVFQGEKSVFSSSEAEQVFFFFSALLNLDNSTLVRSALVNELFGLNGKELVETTADPGKWSSCLNLLAQCRHIWQTRGFLSSFYHILRQRQRVSALSAQLDGERKLTNYLHLAELLQEESKNNPEPERLLHWFWQKCEDGSTSWEQAQLRLESDTNLVRLVTIHKAKGLEYSLVMLPFLWDIHSVNNKKPFKFRRDGNSFLDLGSNRDNNLKRAEEERLAEDLRLLYVALTRAKYGCYLWWGRISGFEKSALAWLLHGGQEAAEQEEVRRVVAEVGGLIKDIESREDNEPVQPMLNQNNKEQIAAAKFGGLIKSSWQMLSYSRLLRSKHQSPDLPDYDQHQMYTDKQLPENGFPVGAAAGTCLHAILEKIDFQDESTEQEIIIEQLKIAGFDPELLPVAREWLFVIRRSFILPDSDFCLHKLKRQNRLDELAFSFPVAGFDFSAFNNLLADFGIDKVNTDTSWLEGMMVGFIDLVYRHDDKYYLIDYKSNCLSSYEQKELTRAMLEHRYDIQMLIYTLALHRYLSHRLNGYDYEKDFGGGQYLFLRGMRENSPASVYNHRFSYELINRFDLLMRGNK